MAAVSDIILLLKGMRPVLTDDEFVYATVHDLTGIAATDALCVFRESEGITVICLRTFADRLGFQYEGSFRQITPSVHSSLQAVGFLAIVSGALARADIPCNAVSAYYHDHIFVPCGSAQKAINVLSALAGADTPLRSDVILGFTFAFDEIFIRFVSEFRTRNC